MLKLLDSTESSPAKHSRLPCFYGSTGGGVQTAELQGTAGDQSMRLYGLTIDSSLKESMGLTENDGHENDGPICTA